MSTKISGRYIGNKKFELTHELSGAKLITAAPVDNNGDGSSFSPTDLVAASLGACMLTIAAIVAEKDNFPLEKMSYEVEKIMTTGSPRRIHELKLICKLPSSLTEAQRTRLEKASKACPVHHSLNPEINVGIEFCYEL